MERNNDTRTQICVVLMPSTLCCAVHCIVVIIGNCASFLIDKNVKNLANNNYNYY